MQSWLFCVQWFRNFCNETAFCNKNIKVRDLAFEGLGIWPQLVWVLFDSSLAFAENLEFCTCFLSQQCLDWFVSNHMNRNNVAVAQNKDQLKISNAGYSIILSQNSTWKHLVVEINCYYLLLLFNTVWRIFLFILCHW